MVEGVPTLLEDNIKMLKRAICISRTTNIKHL